MTDIDKKDGLKLALVSLEAMHNLAKQSKTIYDLLPPDDEKIKVLTDYISKIEKEIARIEAVLRGME